jgi:hypothetical protein
MTSTDRHGHHSAAEMHNEDVAHERSDVEFSTILAFGGGLVVVVAVSFVLMWLLFRVLDHRAAANDPQLSPLARPACPFADIGKCQPGQLPPEPRLQTREPEGLAEFLAKEKKSLERYGWVSEQTGVAHMPIAEAKKLILQRGLPVRPDPSLDPQAGTSAPAMGESSGGRTIGRPAPASGTAPPATAPPAPHGGVHR